MNEKQTEHKNLSAGRILRAAIALIAICAVVVGCLALSGCIGKKNQTTDAPTSGDSESPSAGGTTSEGGGNTSGGDVIIPTENGIAVNTLLSKKEGTVYFSPSSVSVTEKGSVYVSDATNYAVYKLNSEGKVDKTVLFSAQVNKVLATDSAVSVRAGERGGKMFVLDGNLNVKSKIAVGHTPTDLYVADNTAYVANRFSNSVSIVDLKEGKVTSTVEVGREPVCMTVAKGTLYVGCMLPDGASTDESISSGVYKIDMKSGKASGTIRLVNGAQNVNGMAVSPDGATVYVTHLIARYTYPTTQLDRAWINSNAYTAINTADDSTIAFLLDDVESGAANPWDVEVAKDGKALVFSLSGTNEIMSLDLTKVKTRVDKVNAGKNEYIANVAEIANNISFLSGIKERISLSGKGVRDLAVVNGETVYAAEYFSGTVSVINLKEEKVTAQYALGDQPEATAERLGESIWYDATLCYQQWESCASCHPEGRSDGMNWDEGADGWGTPKNTKSMLYALRTPPAMSIGCVDAAELNVAESLHFVYYNRDIDEKMINAVSDYLRSLTPVDSPYLNEDGTYTEAALKGKKLFEEVGCATCHPAPLYSDMQLHKSPYIGQDGTWEDRMMATPTLVEVWRSRPYGFGGMATDMKELVKTFANRELTDEEASNLAEFVLSIGAQDEKYGVEQVYASEGDTTLYTKIVPGATIDKITVRKQVPTASRVADPVITVKLCDKSGKTLEEKKFTPGKMVYNTSTALECGIKVPENIGEGGYLEVTIADASGNALATPFKLVCTSK